MIKTIIFLLLYIIFPSWGFGQIFLGINGGYNFSMPIGNSNGSPHSDASLSVDQNSPLISVFVKNRIPNKVANLGYAAEYYQTGLKGHQSIGGNGSGTAYKYNFNLHFLNLILKPEFVFGSKWKFIINTGVYLGILLHCNTKGDSTTYGPGSVYSGVINETTNHYFKTVNLGLLGGFGTEYPVSDRIVINLEAICTFGITNLASGSLSSSFFNFINTQISFGAAYKFSYKSRPPQEKGKENKKNYLDWYDGR
jgi:hypothetical protein